MQKTETTSYTVTWTAAAGLAAATIPQPLPYMVSQMTATPPPVAARGGVTETAVSFDERLMDAKLATVEARTETKFAQLMGEMRLISTGVSDLKNDFRERLATISAEVGEVKKATAGVKWNILALGIGGGALILGLFAFGAQMMDLAAGLVGIRP